MKRKKKHQPHSLYFVFTSETIKLTQEAIKLFAQSLEGRARPPAKVVFAKETMQQVSKKLDAMKMSVGAICLTTFDSNEKLVIATAIQLYTLDLLEVPSHSRHEKELRQCRQIMKFVLDTRKGPEW